jgi:hypothetical protein
MNRPSLEDLQARFKEMKAEQDYIRMQFFKKLFGKLYPEEDHHIHNKLKNEGPPDAVIMHPSMAEKIISSGALANYCIIKTNPLLDETNIIFWWSKDLLDQFQKAPLPDALSQSKNN